MGTIKKNIWDELGIARSTYFKFKKLGMPEDLDKAKDWLALRQNLQPAGREAEGVMVHGKRYTAQDIIDLRASLLEGQTENVNLKNRIERLNVLEREGELLPAEELTNTLGQIIIPLRKALDQMPENIAGAVNPQDPARAETIMTQELHNIYADLVKSLKANEQTSEFRV
jgi:phage terminase Nu1 subunit (DNA packaging protein)